MLIMPLVGCENKSQETAESPETLSNKSVKSDTHIEKPLSDFQIQMLELAFETASSIPAKPFIKDRSNAQYRVVESCLKLDQPIRATRYADKIDTWQRGLGYADTAFHLAQNGYTGQTVQKGLDLAEQIAAMDHGQKWRSDRIRARIAQTYILLGQSRQADQFRQGLLDSESGQLAAACVTQEIPFDEQIKTLDASIALQNFDVMKNALYVYARLFDRDYETAERRSLTEVKIKTSWDKIPIVIRFDLLVRLAESALGHADSSKARDLLNEAHVLLEDYQWPAEKYIPMKAELAEYRFKAGDRITAQADADTAWSLYSSEREGIECLYRVETLLPLAEAFQLMAYTENSVSIYKQSIHECLENTNLKTRAEDFAAVCCSLAVCGIEPDTELWARMTQVREGLNQIW